MAVFIANISRQEFQHVAIYVGWTETYGHTIIESNTDKSGNMLPIHYSALTPDAGYVWAGKLKGIDYSEK